MEASDVRLGPFVDSHRRPHRRDRPARPDDLLSAGWRVTAAHVDATTTATPRIPIALLVDCEPDARETERGRHDAWVGFEHLFEHLADRRPALAARTEAPARFSWFWRMDAQIELTYGSADWAVRSYARQVSDAEQAGDESGLHTHAWRWDDTANRWLVDHGNPEWVARCLRRSFAAFESAFGRPCRVFRFGDGWLDEAAVDLLVQLGARIDLTVEPGVAGRDSLVATELSTGRIPDRRSAPHRAYRPSQEDFRIPARTDDARLWELPVSTGLFSEPRPSLRDPRRFGRWLLRKKRHTHALNLGFDVRDFARAFDHVVSAADDPHAVMAVRTDVGARPNLMDNVRRNLDGISGHRLAGRFVFTGPTDALARLGGPA